MFSSMCLFLVEFPEPGFRSPINMLKRVVFPAPVGPIIPIVPSGNVDTEEGRGLYLHMLYITDVFQLYAVSIYQDCQPLTLPFSEF